MFRAAILTAVLSATLSWAQAPTNPDDEWNTLPANAPARPPAAASQPAAADLAPAPVPAASSSPGRPPAPSVSAPRPVLEPNTVSMFGARSLGFLTRGEMFYLGFPLLGLRFAMGLAERFDIGVGFDSFYFMMNEPRVTLRLNFFRGTNWSMALMAEGGWAFFNQNARSEGKGVRWLTGRRNFNIVPAFAVSYQGDHPRAARLFLSLQYMLALDTEPFAKDPLDGVPGSPVYGHNVLLRAGAEMPLSAKTSFVFLLGLDIHGRRDDSPVMPACSVGLVTSI
ncbi:MAG: hypothetical protein IPJ65_29980 [Archangiaceae bacterium]|nr:hypothetical protein [Archangiaceae bacterium]